MKYLFIILAFISLSAFSQSVKIDGPTGRFGDLTESTTVEFADLMVVERDDTTRKITYEDFSINNNPIIGKMLTYDDTPTGTTCTTAGEWYKYTVDMDSLHSTNGSSNMTYSHANSELEILYAGRYMVMISLSVSCNNASLVHAGICKNGSVGNFGVTHYDVKFANDNIGLSVHNIPTLNVGDKLSFCYQTDNDGDVISTYHFVMTAHLIH